MRSIFLFFSVIFFSSLISQEKGNYKAYFKTSEGDSATGFIKVRFFPLSDSVHWIKMQESLEFTDEDKKVMILNPSDKIKEVGFWVNNALLKMVPWPGSLLTKELDDNYIFARESVSGKICAYDVTVRRLMGNGPSLFVTRKFYRVSAKEWIDGPSLIGYKKQAAVYFADCPYAAAYFQINNSFMDFTKCIDYYNRICK